MKDPDDDIKHVVYDMLVLAQSMRYMATGISDDTANSMFGFKETALNAAAIKVRTLLHFAFDSRKPADKEEKPAHRDDIIAEDFVKHSKCSPVKPDAALKKRVESYDKFVAHITRTRTTREVVTRTGPRPVRQPKAPH